MLTGVLALGPWIALNGIIGKHPIGANTLTFAFEQDMAAKCSEGNFRIFI